MRQIRILTLLFFAVSAGIAYYFFSSLRTAIVAQREIEDTERVVIDQLQMIRSAQRAYRSAYGKYANSWDTLARFVEEGILYVTTRRERVIMFDYGADSIEITTDTIGSISVRDSLFKDTEYPDFEPRTLSFMPHAEDAEFTLFTDTIERSGVMVHVIEVMDAAPINPKRSRENKYRGLQPLHFGSRVSVSLSGNWE